MDFSMNTMSVHPTWFSKADLYINTNISVFFFSFFVFELEFAFWFIFQCLNRVVSGAVFLKIVIHFKTECGMLLCWLPCMPSHFSHVQLVETLWTVVPQALPPLPPVGFPKMIAGSYGKCLFHFIRYCLIIIWSDCSTLLPVSNGWDLQLHSILVSTLHCHLLLYSSHSNMYMG